MIPRSGRARIKFWALNQAIRREGDRRELLVPPKLSSVRNRTNSREKQQVNQFRALIETKLRNIGRSGSPAGHALRHNRDYPARQGQNPFSTQLHTRNVAQSNYLRACNFLIEKTRPLVRHSPL